MPINSTHHPYDAAAYPLSTRMRKASVSMSNLAPNALVVPVRRATCPSTQSSASATTTRVSPRSVGPMTATTTARTARRDVITFAGC